MRFVLGFLVLLVLLSGGLLAAPSFIDWSQYKDQGLEQVKSISGYDIAIDGDFSVGFLPAPHVKAKTVKVVNPAVSSDPLATFDQLSVGLELAPLFQKQVKVSDVTLIKPVIDLRIDRDGKGNWSSPQVEALMSKSDGSKKSSGNSQAISFSNVDIENGSFRFFDAAKNKTTEVSDINVELSAKTLQGPFDGEGTFKFGGQSVAFDIDAKAIDGDALPLRAKLQYGPYGVSLNGMAGVVQPFDIQGETRIKASASALPISEDITISGILSANQKSAVIKDATVNIGSKIFKGQALVDLNPMNIKAAFEGPDIINSAQFLPAAGGQKKASDPLLILTEILPKEFVLPQDFEADVALKTGGIVYDQILLKNARIKASKKDKLFEFSLKADDIPGTGPASFDGDLTFASRSTSKKGAQVYSDPSLDFTAQANTQNTGQFVKALTGQSNIPVVSSSRIGKFYIKGNARPGRFALKDSVVNLDDLKILMGGSVKQGEAKPVLDFNVTSSIDDPYGFAKSLNIKTDGWPSNLGGVRIGADLKGTMDNLAADAKVNAFGADFTVSGKLDELMSGSALNNLNLRVQHPNLKTFLSNVGASAPAYAAISKPIDARAVVKMDGKVINLSGVDTKLLGTTMKGSLRYDGTASKPSVSGDLNFGELSLKTVKSGSSSNKSGSSGAGKWSSAPMNSGWLHAMNANFDVAAERLIYETWDISKPSLNVVMQNGVLDIQNLKGGLFAGQVALKSRVSSSSSTAPMNVSTQANINNVNIGKLATALSGSKRLQGDGTVSLVMDVAGSGASQSALISSLDGSAELNGQNVVLKGFDLAGLASALLESNKPLSRVQQLVGSSSSGGQTAFDTVIGSYAIQNGVATITSMEMDGPEALITSKGNASLPRWYIDTTHTVTLKNAQSVEPFDVEIKGPLNNPGNTFGKGLFDTYLNEKLGEKIQDLVGDDVGNVLSKFGIIPEQKQQAQPAPANDTEPAAGDAAQPVQERPRAKTQEEQAQEAIEGVIRGLFD